MMQMRDWISGAVGAVLVALAVLPMLGYADFLNNISPNALRWIVVIGAAYLLWNSVIEITNSNILGWWSFGVAAVCLVIGLLPALPWFDFQPFSNTVYSWIILAEGIFLMIATFAMEL